MRGREREAREGERRGEGAKNEGMRGEGWRILISKTGFVGILDIVPIIIITKLIVKLTREHKRENEGITKKQKENN